MGGWVGGCGGGGAGDWDTAGTVKLHGDWDTAGAVKLRGERPTAVAQQRVWQPNQRLTCCPTSPSPTPPEKRAICSASATSFSCTSFTSAVRASAATSRSAQKGKEKALTMMMCE